MLKSRHPNSRWLRNRDKKNSLIALLVLACVFAFARFLKVDQVEQIPLCLFKYFTHFDCPGCGLTRSFIDLAHGQWTQAIRMNALGPLLFIYLLLYFFYHLGRLTELWSFSLSSLFIRGSLSYILFALLFWGQWLVKIYFRRSSL